MFQVKATLVAFMGNTENYPCHFHHNVGDEIVFDGESFKGRLCTEVWPVFTQKVVALHMAGPRYVEPSYYAPIWYAPCSKTDPGERKKDGLGFRNVLKTIEPPPYDMATLFPPNAAKWPPHPEKNVAKDITVMCPDLRTAAVFSLEAFDLSEKGFDTPFFRRQMSILDKLLQQPGTEVERVIDLFTKQSQEDIYPALSPQIIDTFTEELALMDYLKIENGQASVTRKGENKLEAFKHGLPAEDRKAMGL